MTLQEAAQALNAEVSALTFAAPVALVYHPLSYGWEAHAAYLERYGQARRSVLLLGMNPGPFGMAQTGVPFGDVEMVRDWLGIQARVETPAKVHPKRPVLGFQCPRREVSGQRLWGWASARFGTPERFFAQFFVANYCPLVFMTESGRNLTPDALPAAERAPLFAACDEALRSTVELLEPEYLVGIGRFAEERALAALGGRDLRIGRILHPSPASPAANRDWAGQAERGLSQLGIPLPGLHVDA
ncbi:uracil-DNA glycosylase family protein [Halochromatium salexigens]|uniref:Single-stranded DNA-binding protein n=1 Tax=Halochromatium salexigens TaxID=49447 RepID=A0AAJ0UF10_HALSE|nr:uracil-DNA glycosylase family protein [Halochromatium salexigens]MBK5930237.1 single-stranded DNA-binding protein [Halochromatium salexigens]